MEELALVYPDCDRMMINMALDFDEDMQKKYGEDYHWEDHKDEIFPEVVSEPSSNGSGESDSAGAQEQGSKEDDVCRDSNVPGEQ